MDKCKKDKCYYNVFGQCKYFEWAEFYEWRESERLTERKDPICGDPKDHLDLKKT